MKFDESNRFHKLFTVRNLLQPTGSPLPPASLSRGLGGGGTKGDLMSIFHSLLQVSVPFFSPHPFPPQALALLSVYVLCFYGYCGGYDHTAIIIS